LAPAKSAAPRSQRKRGSCSCCSCLQFKNIQSMFHFLWLQPNLQHLAPVLLPPSLALPLKKKMTFWDFLDRLVEKRNITNITWFRLKNTTWFP
jgi:hypothetical protein